MANEQYISHEWKSIACAAMESESLNGCFDCNICFDFAHEPVVTLCGHLYCWPCIYKWLYVQSASLASDEHPQCPVCKADISHNAMVPLYGRGQNPAEVELKGKAPHKGVAIPPRPSSNGIQTLMSTTTSHTGQHLPYRNPYQDHNPYENNDFQEDSLPSLLSHGGTTSGFHHPMVEMFGELVYSRVFGNSESIYAYPNSYNQAGSISPRLRRQEMQAEKSLNRVSIFFFCCFLLCLLVF